VVSILDKKFVVCDNCLQAIKSHGEEVSCKKIYVDENDEKMSKCDFCEENGFDVLHEITGG
jgi:hypothetical protein